MHRATELLAVLVGRTESSHIPLSRNLSPGAKTHDCALKYIKLDTSELALPSLWQYTWDKWIHKGGKLTRVHAFRALWHVTAWCGSMVKKKLLTSWQSGSRQGEERQNNQRGGCSKIPSKAPFVDISIDEIVPPISSTTSQCLLGLGNKLSTWSFWKTTKIQS